MTRAELKKQLGIYRPSLIRPEMLAVSLSERKLMRPVERAWMRFEDAKLAIYRFIKRMAPLKARPGVSRRRSAAA